eukprot:9416785-Pyramimonas_sp.AAC.1
MMGIGFREGWWGRHVSRCVLSRAQAHDTLCTCPERDAPGAAGVCGALGACEGTWRIWRTR